MRILTDPLINMHPLLYMVPGRSLPHFITISHQSPFFFFFFVIIERSVQKAHINLHKVIMTSVTDGGKEQHTHRGGGGMREGGNSGGRGSSVKSRKTVVNFGGGIARSVTSDGLVAGVAPLPADEVGQEHDEDEAC